MGYSRFRPSDAVMLVRQNVRNMVLIARLMVERFGDEAAAQTAERARRYRNEGDPDGAEYWRRVAWIIQDINPLHKDRNAAARGEPR